MGTGIDSAWFKDLHRKTGITQAETAAILGKAPTFLTRIYSGEQELRIADARRIASLMKVPLSQVLVRAGLAAEAEGEPDVAALDGFSEHPARYEVRQVDIEPPSGREGPSNSVSTWRVETNDLATLGIIAGDNLRVDMRVKPRTGDVVIAQIYDWRSATAETVIRGYHHPYLVKTGTTIGDLKPETVDNERVVIKGVVTLVWRERHAA